MKSRFSILVLAISALCSPALGFGQETDSGLRYKEMANYCVLSAEHGGTIELILDAEPWRGWDGFCQRLIAYLRLGVPPWAADQSEESRRLLVSTGFFEEAQCRNADAGSMLSCVVKPARIVQDVKFGGEVPTAVLVEDLRRRVFLRPGVLLGEDERESIERQRRRLEDYLRREGYFGSVVRIRGESSGGAHPNEGVRLNAEVRPGRTVTLRSVELYGVHPLTMREVESRLTHNWLLWWWPIRFRPNQFEDDIEDITRLLYERGYPEARVSGDWRLDLPNAAVDIMLRIDSGPRVQVVIDGNESIRSRRLREFTTFRDAGIVDLFEMEEVAEQIRGSYQESGFHESKVRVSYDESEDGDLSVRFSIEEGERLRISEVEFVGNRVFSDDEILDGVPFMTRPRSWLGGGQYVDDWVEVDRRAIEVYYRERGFGSARVLTEKTILENDSIKVLFRVDEGPLRSISQLRIDGLPAEVDRDALVDRLRLAPEAPFVRERLAQDHREILAALASYGYTRGDLERSVDIPSAEDGGPVSLRYIITHGPKTRLGGVLVRGNFRTQTSLVEDQLGLAPGDDLDLVALAMARRRLRALGPFSSVDLVPLDDWRADERIWLLVEVQEREARTLDGVFSFSTDDRLTIGSDYRDPNLFGRAVRLDLRLRLGRLFGDIHPSLAFIGNTDSFEGQLRAPSPLGMPFDVEGSANYYLHEDSRNNRHEYLSVGGGAIREFPMPRDCQWCPTFVGTLRYEVVAGLFEDLGDAGEIPRVPNEHVAGRDNVGRIVKGFSLDKRDAFVDPMHGYVADLRFELANRLLAPIGEGYSFVRALGGVQTYYRLSPPFRRRLKGERFLGGPVVIANSISFGAARPYGASEYLPDAESFFYGGDHSVRGISARESRNSGVLNESLELDGSSFGSPYMFVGNIEARWYVLEGFGLGTLQLATFVDVGSVSDSFGSLFEHTTISAGPAIRYVTPVGPISLAWGFPLSLPEGMSTGEYGKLHVTFGYAF